MPSGISSATSPGASQCGAQPQSGMDPNTMMQIGISLISSATQMQQQQQQSSSSAPQGCGSGMDAMG